MSSEQNRRRENNTYRPRNSTFSRSNRREWVPRGSAPVVATVVQVPPPSGDSSAAPRNDSGNGGGELVDRHLIQPVVPNRNRIHNGSRGNPGHRHVRVGPVEKQKVERKHFRDDNGRMPKGVNIPHLVQEIQDKLSKGSVECMICYDMVRRSAPVWSCSSCYSIFHLNCIKKWARAPTSIDLLAEKNQGSNWRCPGCQSVQLMSAKEIRYICFCGKRPDPSSDLYLTPHSCGEPCGKPLERELPGSGLSCEDICPHFCVLQCHPGPCPPCKAFAPRRCPCGKKVITTRCSDRRSVLTCGKKCDKLLDCGRHRCGRLCHIGPCDPCEVLVNASCFCRKKIEVIICGDMVVRGEIKDQDGLFSCNLACENKLNCGNHTYQEICHPGPCGECELLPVKIKACCCGKTSLNEERRSCLDPVPTCTQICGKTLPCRLHNCQNMCHSGPCLPCNVFVSQKCRCGSTSRRVECYRTAPDSENFTCDKTCGRKKSCGRHRCSDRCCPLSNSSNSSVVDGDPHLCRMPCEKKLRCGQHSCISLCHSGHCPPCLETIFADLTCACGKTSIPPPLPCGTPPPSCQYPCLVPQPCGHPSSHSCHFGDCPPCTIPIPKECVGGHVVLRSIPCGSKDIRCNKLCGKTRQCGLHACSRTCHLSPCDSSGASSTSVRISCRQTCGAPRRDCRHTCTAICHPATPCPDVKCEFPVTINCSCGRLNATVPCDAGCGNGGYSADTVLEASIIQKLPAPLQPAEENGEKIPLGQRKLMCDDECAKMERKKVLADAFGVNPPTLEALHFGDAASMSEVLSDLMRRDPKWVLSVEERCRYLVHGRGRGGHNALKVHVFCVMTKDKRDAVRLVAERWKLSINAAGWEPKRFIIVHVTPKSKSPARILVHGRGRGRGGHNALKVHVFCVMTKDKRDAVRLVAERWKLSINAAGWEPKRFIIVHVTPKSKSPACMLGVKSCNPFNLLQPPLFDPLLDMDPRLVVALFDLPREADVSALVLRFGGECELVWLNDKNALAVFSDPGRAATAMRRLDQGSVYYGAVAVPQNSSASTATSGASAWGSKDVAAASGAAALKGNPWKKVVLHESEHKESSWGGEEWATIGTDPRQHNLKQKDAPIASSSNRWSVLQPGSSSSSFDAYAKTENLQKQSEMTPTVSASPSLQVGGTSNDTSGDVVDDWEKACD